MQQIECFLTPKQILVDEVPFPGVVQAVFLSTLQVFEGHFEYFETVLIQVVLEEQVKEILYGSIHIHWQQIIGQIQQRIRRLRQHFDVQDLFHRRSMIRVFLRSRLLLRLLRITVVALVVLVAQSFLYNVQLK